VNGDGADQQRLSTLLGGADGQQGDEVGGTLVTVELKGVTVDALAVLVDVLANCITLAGVPSD
jgi:hypothetical protein